MAKFNFNLERRATGSKARAGRIRTLHGEIRTPVFMPVGTQATVKGTTTEGLKETGSQIILANTYHLLLRPGPEVFQQFGGIHRFMNWVGPVLTDSGGFQIFSLPHARAMNEDGATFQSYVDGKTFLLSPESSIDMQKAIGSDIMMVLDHCVTSKADYNEAKAAMELTHRWAERSLAARGNSPQALFGIVQGACFTDLREKSAAFLQKLPFDGIAIGGLAVGETQQERYEFTGLVTDMLPDKLPRYLMGVGTPLDILEAVHRGVDMFDCIMPSQLAHRGVAFTSHGLLHFRRQVYKFSEDPVDKNCSCHVCRHYSRAYIHHLVKAGEVLGWHLLTHHNLAYYHRLMVEIRENILAGTFWSFYETMRLELDRKDEHNPGVPPKAKQMPKPPRLGDYEIVDLESGAPSIRQISSGEVFISAGLPEKDAFRIYIDQPGLASKLVNANEEPLIIWDIWLGAATNLMAAINCYEELLAHYGKLRPMHIYSFERDLDPLRLACRDANRFPHLRHSAPYKLLEREEWHHPSGLLTVQLVEGDFFVAMSRAVPPHLIFYDPFSPESEEELWQSPTFEKIRKMASGRSCELITVASSIEVRLALLSAGFFVGEGISTSTYSATTLAYLSGKDFKKHQWSKSLLKKEWLTQWCQRGFSLSDFFSEEEKHNLCNQLFAHPQFK